jgi:hypothetical protein
VTGPTLYVQYFQFVWNGLWGKFVSRSPKDENHHRHTRVCLRWGHYNFE